jgi:hypothetical protein
MSEIAKSRNPEYYKKSFHSTEARAKAVLSLNDGRMKGVNKGAIRDDDFRARVSKALKGKKKPAGFGAKISAAKRKVKSVKCPYCEKIGYPSLMKRWHFDNCKHKA